LVREQPERISGIRFSRNFGQLSAISAGLRAAHGDCVAVMSADLQDPAELLVDMFEKWRNGFDVVIAHRIGRDDDLLSRSFSKIAYTFAKRSIPNMPSGGFDFFLLDKEAVGLLNSFQGRHRFFQGDILWLGLPTEFVGYRRQKRTHGKSGWTFNRKFKYFVDLVLDSSFAPIQFMSRLGILTALIGVVYAAVVIVAYFREQTPFEGWTPIMVTLLIVGGLIMSMLGLIGEYLWRIYDEIKARPTYVVDGVIGLQLEVESHQRALRSSAVEAQVEQPHTERIGYIQGR
jgi:glycosyltransferase involved in cell wall biosynthesis